MIAAPRWSRFSFHGVKINSPNGIVNIKHSTPVEHPEGTRFNGAGGVKIIMQILSNSKF